MVFQQGGRFFQEGVAKIQCGKRKADDWEKKEGLGCLGGRLKNEGLGCNRLEPDDYGKKGKTSID